MSIPPAALPYALHPRENLTRNQIALLRHADYWQMCRTGKGEWAGGGRRTRGKTMRPLITRQLLAEDYKAGKVFLRVTMAGRIALDTLNEASRNQRSAPAKSGNRFSGSDPKGRASEADHNNEATPRRGR